VQRLLNQVPINNIIIQTDLDAQRFRQWCPLSTASKVKGWRLFEIVQAGRCHVQMKRGEILLQQKVQKIMQFGDMDG
jgi:hypothetical protein